MTPTMMRQFWYLVEATRSTIPIKLDDGSLTQWLLRRVRLERSLDRLETDILSAYIHSRLSLIRDLAQGSS